MADVTFDLHLFINILTGVVMAGIGWFCRELWDAVQALRSDLQKLEVRISAEYVRYDRLQDALRPVMEHLKRIEDKLDDKADKQ